MHEPLPFRTAIADTANLPVRHVLHRDYEMRSHAILKSVGTRRYAADPDTNVICCAYAVDDASVELWIPGAPVPPEFLEAARNPDWLVAAHGDHFEAAVECHIMAPRHGWPEIPIQR